MMMMKVRAGRKGGREGGRGGGREGLSVDTSLLSLPHLSLRCLFSLGVEP